MNHAVGRVLKAKDINMKGSFHLDVGQADGGVGHDICAHAVSPQASIVENHPDFAILEITCKCGTKSRVRCEYAG